MYLIINGNRHTVSRRIAKSDTIKFLSVTPTVVEITGTIQMYRDDGFLMSEDNTDGYERKYQTGTLLTLTNKPVPTPAVHVPTLEESMAAAITDGVNDV